MSSQQPTEAQPWAADGQMADLVAATEWSDTPLGPAAEWPQSLRTALSICLSSRFPMLVWWGPQLLQFYNDAHQPAMGDKHPRALGQRAQECWDEVWPEIGPLARTVLAEGTSTYAEDRMLFLERHGYVEKTYWTFSFSPIRDESTRVGGIIVIATESTDRVLAARRLQVLRELGGLSTTSTASVEEACCAAVDVLAGHRAELPSTLVYLRDGTGPGLRLVASTGTDLHDGEIGDAVAGSDLEATVHRVAAGGPAELTRTVDDVFAPGPMGDAPVGHALVLPLRGAGAERTTGVLVAGVSPYRELDTDYRAFFDLVAGHVTTAVTDALAYQAERHRAEALAELDQVKTDFFASVSHEFRTPLTLIMGPLAELRRSTALAGDRRVHEELEAIHRNSLRLHKLVNTLLDFARLQAGRMQARFEPVDLAGLTTELAGVFRSAIERAGLEYTVDCPPLPEPVLVDRDMWEKIVLNLLSNAVKYTFTGGIAITLHAFGDSAVLTVSDTGTGVAGGDLPRLFERFHRAEGSQGRSVEGSGIGLAMVRELIGLHGGTVSVDSAPGTGSTFTVALPLGSAHLPPDQIGAPDGSTAGADSRAAAPTRVADTAEPFLAEALRWLPDLETAEGTGAGAGSPDDSATGGTVLIADDNADMREYLQRLLSSRHAVRAVPDGTDALYAALTDPPDLIVSDVLMPGMGGIELVAALRADPRTAAVPVLLLSARAGQEAAVEGLASGADDYLVKPFVAAELLAKVDSHVRSGRVRREAERRFRTLADSTPAMIWVDGVGEQRIFVNRTWQDFLGAERAEDWHGRAWRDRIHPEDRARHDAARADAQSASEPFELEYRLRCADGRYRWVFDKGQPLGTPEQPGGFVGGCLDIDTRYRQRQRGRLLARFGAALDRETTVQARREVLLRMLVDHGLVDVARLIDIEDGVPSRMVAVAGRSAEEERLLRALEGSWPLAQEVVATGEPGLVAVDEDYIVAASPDDPAQREVRRKLGLRTVALIPLSTRGRVVGLLAGARTAGSPGLDRADMDLVAEICERAATALDNALLLAAESDARRAAEEFGTVLAALSRATTPADVGEVILGHAARLGAASAVVVIRALDRADQLSLLTASGPAVPYTNMPVSATHPLAYAVRTAEPVWAGTPTGQADAGTANSTAPTLQVAVPLVVAGVAIGAIGMQFADGVAGVPADRRAAVLTLARQCAQALDRARLHEAEHDVAEILQRSLLPHDLPALDRLDAAARYMPGAVGLQAGGDWYDLLPVGETSAALVVGDVVGHGAAAAAVMGQLRSALAGYLLDGYSPASALERLDGFAGRIPGAVGSTCACLVLDWRSGQLCWATAGHPPVLLLEPGGSRYLHGGAGPVLGLRGRAPYRQEEAVIEPGASVVLYTDGLVERRGEVIDDGLARLAGAAAALRDRSPDTLVTTLVQEVVDDAAHADDIALVAVRLVPAPLRDRVPAEGSVLRAMRRAVESWAATAGLNDEATDDLQFALGEAAANAVEHAYPDGTGEFDYEVVRTIRGSIAVRVRDHGAWRPAPADRGHRGRGLQVIHALAENVRIDAGPDGTDVRFELPVRSRRPSEVWSPPPPAEAGANPHVLQIRDDLDLAGAAAARADLLAAAAGPQPVVIDLLEVGYLSSSGIGLLTEVADTAEESGVPLTVRVAPGSAAARVLSLTGLASTLPITS